MRTSPNRKFLVHGLVVGLLALAITTVPCLAKTARTPEVIALYDDGNGEFPEGIAVDKRGNVFVSISALGLIDKITPDGNVEEFAVLDPAVSSFFWCLGTRS